MGPFSLPKRSKPLVGKQNRPFLLAWTAQEQKTVNVFVCPVVLYQITFLTTLLLQTHLENKRIIIDCWLGFLRLQLIKVFLLLLSSIASPLPSLISAHKMLPKFVASWISIWDVILRSGGEGGGGKGSSSSSFPPLPSLSSLLSSRPLLIYSSIIPVVREGGSSSWRKSSVSWRARSDGHRRQRGGIPSRLGLGITLQRSVSSFIIMLLRL